MNEGLQTLQEELDKTAVISKDFKSFIIGWAMHACTLAYEAGHKTGYQAGALDEREAAYDAGSRHRG